MGAESLVGVYKQIAASANQIRDFAGDEHGAMVDSLVDDIEQATATAQGRAQTLETALRHARGIAASEVTGLIAAARERFVRVGKHALYPDDAMRDLLRGAVPGSPAGRVWAQIAEREAWIAAWDAALDHPAR